MTTIVDIDEYKLQSRIDHTDEDYLLYEKLEAAQGHIERLLGYKIAERFGGAQQEPIPASLKEAVRQLAAYWFEQRETALVGENAEQIPYGVWSIVSEYRDYTMG